MMTKQFLVPIIDGRYSHQILFSFLMPSSEDKIEENNESDGDQNSNDPVHVFPAAHLHFDVLGGLFHHHGLFFE